MAWREGYIAVDWGTTNRRAYAVGRDGALLASFADDCGLRAVPSGGFEAAVAAIRERLGDRPMLLAGMVGSNLGWREAPYVPCPAGPEDLARAILWIEPGRTGIVPGVSQRGEAGADVMRGEETQIIGAVAAGLAPADGLVCHPGTHSKWILLAGGRIRSFRTMMTGELFDLLRKHSILAEQLGGEVAIDASFRRGLAEGLAGSELLSALFAIRARHLLHEDEGNAAAFASGLLVGGDVRAGLSLHADGPVALIGRPDLCDFYAAAVVEAGRPVTRVDGAEAFLAGTGLLTEMLE